MKLWADRLDALLEHSLATARWLAIAGGGLMLVCSFLIVIDVLARRLVGVSTWGADEFSYYAMAISASWSLAFALLAKAHIRIDFIRNQLKLPGRVLFDVVALCGMAFTSIMFSAATWEIFHRSWLRGTTSITQLATPLWIPQLMWFAGFAFFSVLCGLLLVRTFVALVIQRSPSAAENVIGVLSVEAESAEAISDLKP